MTTSPNDFQVLDALDSGEITTQRQLADSTGISLGQINYTLRRLLARGLVKVGNFKRSRNKVGYAYLLTPKGIEEKSRLAVRFVLQRLEEYDRIRERLAGRLTPLQGDGWRRVVFIGPEEVLRLVAAIIEQRQLRLVLVDHLAGADDLGDLDPDRFDLALVFDESRGDPRRLAREAGLPPARVVALY